MRRWVSVFLFFIFFLAPIGSFAAQAPLTLKGKSVYVPDETEIELVHYNAFFRIRTGFTSADISMVIKNQDVDRDTTIRMGMPVQNSHLGKFRELSVYSDGKPLKVVQRSSLKKPPTEKKVEVDRWYVWEVSLEPGESKVVDHSFVFDNGLELDGSETVIYPMELLENWNGPIKHIQIITDLDFYAPYAFEPMPSIAPVQYDNGGRLTFQLDNVSHLPSVFSLTFKPMDVVISRYIDQTYGEEKEIKGILDAYKNRSYHQTIELIHDYLNVSDDIGALAELKYLEALSYQYLYDLDKALSLYDQLEPNPGFGDDLSQTVKNKIIYDKVTILKGQPDSDEKILNYLTSVKDDIDKGTVFDMWLEQEIAHFTPQSVIEPDPENSEKDKKEAEEAESESNPKDEANKITIGNYQFYFEEIVIAALVLLIIILIIISIIRRKRRRRRSSIFRY